MKANKYLLILPPGNFCKGPNRIVPGCRGCVDVSKHMYAVTALASHTVSKLWNGAGSQSRITQIPAVFLPPLNHTQITAGRSRVDIQEVTCYCGWSQNDRHVHPVGRSLEEEEEWKEAARPCCRLFSGLLHVELIYYELIRLMIRAGEFCFYSAFQSWSIWTLKPDEWSYTRWSTRGSGSRIPSSSSSYFCPANTMGSVRLPPQLWSRVRKA